MEKQAKGAKSTLGDVLYSGGAMASESEKAWVALLQSIAAHDPRALHALFERAHRLVYTLILRITGNPDTAERLTSQVFYDVWSYPSSFDAAKETVLGWIMNQARSRALEWSQKENLADSRPESAAADRFAEQTRLLREALQTLTQHEREAIESAYFSDSMRAQVGGRLSQPSGAVRTWIRSGLIKLRHALAGNP